MILAEIDNASPGAVAAVRTPGIVLRGTPPARDEYELADRMRVTGLEPRALPATAAWLSSEKRSSPRTRRGYSQDLSWWLAYLQVRGLDEMDVAPLEADLYGAALREAALAPATRERRISAASSWYRYLIRAGVATSNPFTDMERAQPPARSKTRGLAKADLDRMLAWTHAQADAIAAAHELGRAAPSRVRDSARAYAMLCLFVVTACRVGGIIDAQLSSLGYDAGHRVIDLPAKGRQGTTLRAAIPPYAGAALERYLDLRGPEPGPLFRTDTGRPLDQPAIFRKLREIARKAQVATWDQLSPHSLRHSIATYLLGQGMALHIVQDLLGHADPRTTRRYDLARGALERSPAYQLGQAFAQGEAHAEQMITDDHKRERAADSRK